MKCASLSILAVASSLLVGCTTTMLVPIAGGGKAEVSFGSKGPEKASSGGIRIERAGMELNTGAKALNYVFDFTVSDNRAPKSVIVEDVSDNLPEASVLAEDDNPVLADRHWHFISPSKTLADPEVGWLLNIEDSMRIYRFTITTADGTKLVLYEPSGYSNAMKASIRKALGADE